MAKRRQAAPISLTDRQRARLERLWFIYGNYGPKTTPGNHQFIQGLLEHGLDLRPLQTKRTAKRDRPTGECEAAVEAILSSNDDNRGEAERPALLRLVPSPDVGRKTVIICRTFSVVVPNSSASTAGGSWSYSPGSFSTESSSASSERSALVFSTQMR